LNKNSNADYFIIQENPSLFLSYIKERDLFPMEKIKEILYLVVTLMILSLLRGSSTTPSIIGIDYCGGSYWLVYALIILACGYFTLRSVKNFQMLEENKINNPPPYNLRIPASTTLSMDKMPGLAHISLWAGVLAGMLIGGGIILNAYILQMGFTPQSTSATTALFVMLPAFMSMFVTLLAGRVALDEFIWFFGLSIIGSFIISTTLSYLVRKYKRQSLLLILLCIVLLLVILVVPTYGIAKMYANPSSMLSFSSLC